MRIRILQASVLRSKTLQLKTIRPATKECLDLYRLQNFVTAETGILKINCGERNEI